MSLIYLAIGDNHDFCFLIFISASSSDTLSAQEAVTPTVGVSPAQTEVCLSSFHPLIC